MIIYIGFDSSNYGQKLAFEVCKRSILKYNKNLIIKGLYIDKLKEEGIYKREDNTGATEFTYTRFLVPYLNNYKGWAMFCDSDFLWFCDIEEVINKYKDTSKALLCVKHKHTKCNNNTKMDGKKQEWYPRKNWSSLMFFNCGHPDIKNLTLDNVNNKSAKWLHRMEYCDDNNIGELPIEYNYLVDYYNTGNYKALHFTDGGPWHEKYRNVMYGDLWINYLNPLEKLKLFHKKNSEVLCITSFNKKLYEDYAYRFTDTYNLPFDLIIYGEDNLEFLKEKYKNVNYNFTIANSIQLMKDLNDFIKRNTKRDNNDSKRGFLYQGIRFCHKVFAVTHAGVNFKNYKYIIWFDADMIFKKSFDLNLIETKLIKKETMMSHLGRANYHSECGFLVFNMKHNKTIDYFREMRRMYTSDDIYKEKEWHDSYIWDVVRRKFENKFKVKNFNLTDNTRINDVIGSIFLNEYFYHLKGKRKFEYNK